MRQRFEGSIKVDPNRIIFLLSHHRPRQRHFLSRVMLLLYPNRLHQEYFPNRVMCRGHSRKDMYRSRHNLFRREYSHRAMCPLRFQQVMCHQ